MIGEINLELIRRITGFFFYRAVFLRSRDNSVFNYVFNLYLMYLILYLICLIVERRREEGEYGLERDVGRIEEI